MIIISKCNRKNNSRMVNLQKFFHILSVKQLKRSPYVGYYALKIIFFLTTFTFSCMASGVQYGFFTSYDYQLIRIAKVPSKQGITKGTIVLLQGMGGFIEYYLDIMENMASKGFDVLTMDWRGQGDSGRFTDQPTLLYVDNFDSYVKDLNIFLSNNDKLKRPIIFLASSMGGNIAIHYARRFPKSVDAVVALAPMIKINTTPYPYPIAETMVNFLVSLGLGRNFVFGYQPFSYEHCVQNYNPAKNGDKKTYMRDCELLKKKPQLAIGGPSFQWLKAAFQASSVFENEDFLRQIKTPFLILSSKYDYLVNTEAQAQICHFLPNCQIQVYEDAHHNILKDQANIIYKVINAVDLFYVNLHTPTYHKPSQQMVYQENIP